MPAPGAGGATPVKADGPAASAEEPRVTADGPAAPVEELLAAVHRGLEAGAGALWAALTVRARAPLGDVAGAKRALERELWAPLVGHATARIEPWELAGDAARTRVRVAGSPAGDAVFLVSLRRTSDGWRVTGLRRDDLPWS